MKFLFDTDFISATRRPALLPQHVVEWMQSIAEPSSFISVISLLEIEAGIRRRERTDPAKGAVLRRWKSLVVAETFRGRVLVVDEAVAEAAAALHATKPRPQHDALIAATAIVHRMIVVTRNVRDFAPMGVAFVDPWANLELYAVTSCLHRFACSRSQAKTPSLTAS